MRLETNKSKLDKLAISISIDQQVIVDRCYISGLGIKIGFLAPKINFHQSVQFQRNNQHQFRVIEKTSHPHK